MDRGESERRLRATLAAALVALAALFTVLPLVLARPLLDPDEGLHAAIAQEMVARGDYVTPTFLGEPFLDKPILFFWAEAASLRVFGSTEAAVRLPPLLFGLLGILSMWLLARSMLGTTFGTAAPAGTALVYGTMLLPLALSQTAVHDIALVPFLNLAVLCLWHIVEGRRIASNAIGAGVALGLSVLTKGLVGVAFAGFALVAFAAVRPRRAVRLGVVFAVALAIAALVAAPWYVAMERAHPGYLHYYFVDRHLRGYLTSTQPHAEGAWWYYVPIVFAGALPWTVHIGTAILDARRSAAAIAAWIWFVIGFLFLTAGESKLATYALPLFPALALAVGAAWTWRLEAKGRTTGVLVYVHLAVMATLTLGGLWFAGSRFDVTFSPTAWTLAGVAVCLPLALTGWSASARRRVALTAWTSAALFTVAISVVLGAVAPQLSGRALARFFNARGQLPPHVFLADDRLGSLVFYLDPRLRAEVRHDRIETIDLFQVPQRLGTVPPDSVVAVRARRVDRFDLFFPRRPQAFAVTVDGEYHLYRIRELIDATVRR
ncbi:MAG TPA: glycosyltransferase family 39 protein [Vicinamibacterales bacterium]|nr:glycosyltransferase family 39 protein [Vicinamibacterales bacterium]